MVARGMSATALSARRNSCADQLGLGAGDHLVGCLGGAELGDLRAGREDAVAAGDDHRAGRVVAQALRHLGELPQHRLRQRVDLGVVQAHDGHAVVAPVEVYEARHGGGRYPLVQQGLGGGPRVDAPGRDLGRQLLEASSTGRERPLVEQRRDDAHQLVLHPRGAPGLEGARGGEVLAVLADGGPQLRRPLAGAGGRGDHRRPPAVGGGEVEHALEVAAGLVGPGTVGLVDHEHVGDLEQAGLVGLHRVAPARVHHHHGGVGGPGHLHLHLAHPDRLDDDPRPAGGVEDAHRFEGGEREPTEVAARGHRTDEHAVVGGVVGHADAIAEDGAAGER